MNMSSVGDCERWGWRRGVLKSGHAVGQWGSLLHMITQLKWEEEGWKSVMQRQRNHFQVSRLNLAPTKILLSAMKVSHESVNPKNSWGGGSLGSIAWRSRGLGSCYSCFRVRVVCLDGDENERGWRGIMVWSKWHHCRCSKDKKRYVGKEEEQKK